MRARLTGRVMVAVIAAAAATHGCGDAPDPLGTTDAAAAADDREATDGGDRDAGDAPRTTFDAGPTSPDGGEAGTDTEPPETRLLSAPVASVPGVEVRFEFESTEAGSFRCRIDDTGEQPCSSPYLFTPNDEGEYMFRVRAMDNAGNLDASPEVHRWQVSLAPETALISGPPAFTPERAATFEVSASMPGAEFECQLDGAVPWACDATFTLTDLAPGPHTLEVAAHDGAGHVDPTPLQVDWTVIESPQGWATACVGNNHACALTSDGELYCWGDNDSRQLGLGDRVRRTLPTRVGDGSTWAALACGRIHTCARKANDSVWCWGDNRAGQLGLGDLDVRSTPTNVASLAGSTQITAGDWHTCALDSDGDARCFGLGSFGRLGTGSEDDGASPAAVDQQSPYLRIEAGAAHTCATRDDNVMVCWGRANAGQLGAAAPDTCNVGQGADPCALSPTASPGTGPWNDLSLGPDYGCRIDAADALACWGHAGSGVLGSATDAGAQPATHVVGAWSQVSSGSSHACGISAGGLHCWGNNANGQLGVASIERSQTPVRVGARDDWKLVRAATVSSCAIANDHSLWCWGDGDVATSDTPAWMPFDGELP